MKHLKLFEDWNLMESLASARKMYLNTNQISDEEFNLIKDLDPSKNFKYVEKMIEVYLKDSPSLEELAKVFRDFDEMSKKNQLKNSDITSYRSFSEILDTTQRVFSEYKEKIDSKLKASEVDIVYEDDRVLVLIPRTHEAVCKYGSGTRWCITAVNPSDYMFYKQNLVTHYFIIMKAFPTSDPNYKMAVSVYEDEKIECNDSLDKIIPIEKVLEISGLDRDLFISNPTDVIDMKLFKAILKRDVEEVKELIEVGAKVDAEDEWGYSPLHRCVVIDSIVLVKLLVGEGAKLDAKNNNGHTPLHLAVEDDRFEISKFLVESGAEVNIKDNIYGETPLHWAVRRGNVAITSLLIEWGADLDVKEHIEGNTPLHWAVIYNRESIVKILIEAGAKIDIENKEGRSPLYLAYSPKMQELFKLNGEEE